MSLFHHFLRAAGPSWWSTTHSQPVMLSSVLRPVNLSLWELAHCLNGVWCPMGCIPYELMMLPGWFSSPLPSSTWHRCGTSLSNDLFALYLSQFCMARLVVWSAHWIFPLSSPRVRKKRPDQLSCIQNHGRTDLWLQNDVSAAGLLDILVGTPCIGRN